MPDVLDQARKAIEAGLRELDHEAGRLRNALANLGGGTPAGNDAQPQSGDQRLDVLPGVSARSSS